MIVTGVSTFKLGRGDSELYTTNWYLGTLHVGLVSRNFSKFSAFGAVPSGPACSPVGIVTLRLGAFGERACWWDVGLLVVSGFAGGESFAGELLFEFCW